MKSVMSTDQTGENFSSHLTIVPPPGAATVRLEMPLHMQSALIFHYNLKFYNKDADNFEGVSLKRFVMQVSFHFPLPAPTLQHFYRTVNSIQLVRIPYNPQCIISFI